MFEIIRGYFNEFNIRLEILKGERTTMQILIIIIATIAPKTIPICTFTSFYNFSTNIIHKNVIKAIDIFLFFGKISAIHLKKNYK